MATHGGISYRHVLNKSDALIKYAAWKGSYKGTQMLVSLYLLCLTLGGG